MTKTASARWRPIAAATVAAGALAVGALALTAPANSEAREWDIGAYDQCVGAFDGVPSVSAADYERWEDHMKLCCDRTGGVFRYAGANGCVAPPAEEAERRPTLPDFGGPAMTLWRPPPPVGPAAPPASEATLTP
jgi:hypothetical protein